MKKPYTLLLSIAALTLSLISPVCGQTSTGTSSQQTKLNIIHIIADDIGYDDLSGFGAPKIKTPNLDRLAKEGIKFTNFYAPHPTCTPTRVAVLTGRYAARTPRISEVLFPRSQVGLNPAQDISIATLLKLQGYRTALIGKWHIGHLPQFLPTKNGFDSFFGIPYPNDHDPVRPEFSYAPPMPLYRNTEIVEQPAQLPTLPERLLDEAIKFIKTNKDQPFYLHFANVETHTPWFVGTQFQNRSADGAFGDAVESFDWSVGQLMAMVRYLGLEENTLVVFSSDNGPLVHAYPDLEAAYGRYATVNTNRPHSLREGKYQARYEGGTRVSAIMRWPGKIPAGSVNDEIVMGCDLFTVFAKLGGASPPTDRPIDGKDITPLMFGKANAKSPHEAFYHFARTNLFGVRWQQWKLVLPRQGAQGKTDKTELYDLSSDPGEKKDVAAERPDILKKLLEMAARARKNIAENRPL